MELALRIGSIVIGALGIALAVIQSIRVYKAKKKSNPDITYLDVVMDTLVPKMEEAETDMTGKARKTYVKQNLMLVCQGLGITYSDALFDKVIERLIKFSKVVNAEEKEKEEITAPASNTGYGQV